MSNIFIFKFKFREMLYLSTLEKIIVTIDPSNTETWSLSRKRKQEELRSKQERGVNELSDGWHHFGGCGRQVMVSSESQGIPRFNYYIKI